VDRAIEGRLLEHFAMRRIWRKRNVNFRRERDDAARRILGHFMVVVMHVASAVATRSVGENASPLPLLSVGASVEIFDWDGPCVASQCKSPVYVTSTLTMSDYGARFVCCHVEHSGGL
jgi:hypothetical protein